MKSKERLKAIIWGQQIDAHELPETVQGAFDLGYRTKNSNLVNTNPYPSDSPLFNAWEEGFQQFLVDDAW